MQYSRLPTPPVTVITPGSNGSGIADDKLRKSSATQVLVLSSIQVAMGILCIVSGTILINMNYSEIVIVERLGYGIWIGVYYLLVGVVGISAAKCNNACLITACMVLNIVCSALWCLPLLSFAANGLITTSFYSCLLEGAEGMECNTSVAKVFYAFESLMLLMAIAEFVITIWCAALCCGAVCRCCKPAPIPTQVIQCTTTPVLQNGQIVVVPNTSMTAYTSTTTYPAQSVTMPAAQVHQAPAAGFYSAAQAPPTYNYSWGTSGQVPQYSKY